ncbi:MAG: 4Fe-4S binding protein [Candidatus Woesearchaeota archaeon]
MANSDLRVDEKLCEACGMCVEACPNSNFEMVEGNGRIVSSWEKTRCDQCGSCIEKCECGAISVNGSVRVMVVDKAACNGCERCVLVCPEKLYEIFYEEGAYFAKRKHGRCRLDGLCAFVCRTEAIR